MGIWVIGDLDGAALYDSVTMTAFGPIFNSKYEAEKFLDWYYNVVDECTDLRIKSRYEIGNLLDEFRKWMTQNAYS